MIRRFFASLILAAVAGLVIKSLPDIARYLKMREMWRAFVDYVFVGLIVPALCGARLVVSRPFSDIRRYVNMRRL